MTCLRQAGAGVPYALYWITAPLATVGLLVVLYQYGMVWVPRLFAFLAGARATSVAPVVVKLHSRPAGTLVSLSKAYPARCLLPAGGAKTAAAGTLPAPASVILLHRCGGIFTTGTHTTHTHTLQSPWQITSTQ